MSYISENFLEIILQMWDDIDIVITIIFIGMLAHSIVFVAFMCFGTLIISDGKQPGQMPCFL